MAWWRWDGLAVSAGMDKGMSLTTGRSCIGKARLRDHHLKDRMGWDGRTVGGGWIRRPSARQKVNDELRPLLQFRGQREYRRAVLIFKKKIHCAWNFFFLFTGRGCQPSCLPVFLPACLLDEDVKRVKRRYDTSRKKNPTAF